MLVNHTHTYIHSYASPIPVQSKGPSSGTTSSSSSDERDPQLWYMGGVPFVEYPEMYGYQPITIHNDPRKEISG